MAAADAPEKPLARFAQIHEAGRWCGVPRSNCWDAARLRLLDADDAAGAGECTRTRAFLDDGRRRIELRVGPDQEHPDDVLDVDTTDVRPNKCWRMADWGFPEVWDVPEAYTQGRPARETADASTFAELYRESEESRAFRDGARSAPSPERAGRSPETVALAGWAAPSETRRAGRTIPCFGNSAPKDEPTRRASSGSAAGVRRLPRDLPAADRDDARPGLPGRSGRRRSQRQPASPTSSTASEHSGLLTCSGGAPVSDRHRPPTADETHAAVAPYGEPQELGHERPWPRSPLRQDRGEAREHLVHDRLREGFEAPPVSGRQVEGARLITADHPDGANVPASASETAKPRRRAKLPPVGDRQDNGGSGQLVEGLRRDEPPRAEFPAAPWPPGVKTDQPNVARRITAVLCRPDGPQATRDPAIVRSALVAPGPAVPRPCSGDVPAGATTSRPSSIPMRIISRPAGNVPGLQKRRHRTASSGPNARRPCAAVASPSHWCLTERYRGREARITPGVAAQCARAPCRLPCRREPDGPPAPAADVPCDRNRSPLGSTPRGPAQSNIVRRDRLVRRSRRDAGGSLRGRPLGAGSRVADGSVALAASDHPRRRGRQRSRRSVVGLQGPPRRSGRTVVPAPDNRARTA